MSGNSVCIEGPSSPAALRGYQVVQLGKAGGDILLLGFNYLVSGYTLIRNNYFIIDFIAGYSALFLGQS